MTTGLPRRVLLLVPFMPAAPARAAQALLLYVREASCPYCRLWDKQIGPIYPRSAEARRAPLREIDRRDPVLGRVGLASPIIYTPTFVLLIDSRERGRIEGFAGEDFFWGQLERLLLRAAI